MAGKFNLADHLKAQSPVPVPRTIEMITEEIQTAKRAGGEAIITIGQRLIEAKRVLSHGEWLPWLTEQVEFSERTAQNFMRLARDWSNPQTLADLGMSKALTLLALPADEREEFISATHTVDGEEKAVLDMSARELAQAIREKEQAQADLRAAEAAREKMSQDMAMANERMAGLQADLDRAKAAESQAVKELAELKARPVEVAVEQVADPAAIAEARTKAIAEMQEKLDKAKEAKAKAEEKRKAAEAALETANSKLSALEKEQKRADMAQDKDLVMFEALFSQAQDQITRLYGFLLKHQAKDSPHVEGMRKALLALSDKIREAAQ